MVTFLVGLIYSFIQFGMVGRGYVMNVSRSYVMTVGRLYDGSSGYFVNHDGY